MQIFLIGGGLWGVAILALIRLLYISGVFDRSERIGRIRFLWLFGLMLAVAGMLVMRPHEDIFGGQDPGSYINSGITYGNKAAFFHVDPMLSMVEPELRPLFYFGHAGYGATKDACLWVRDPVHAIVGPNFQPAYPLLIAVATRCLHTPLAALYVVPLFTVFTGLALWALLNILWPGRRAGLAAFWIFIMMPLVLWHARAPRPEMIASFMAFGGLTLLVNAGVARRGMPIDVWLGGICLMLAPFFHVSAWFIVLPALIVMLFAVGVGRRDFLPVFFICAAAFGALYWQALNVTDYYRMGHLLRRFLRSPLMLISGIMAGASVLGAGYLARRFAASFSRRYMGWGAWLCALAVPAFLVFYYFRRDRVGSLPLLGRPVEHLLYLTDFQAVVNMIALPTALLALAGWIAWCVGPGTRRMRVARLTLGLTLFPAVCLAGRMDDFFMTRYLMVAIAPLAALCLATLACSIPRRYKNINLHWLMSQFQKSRGRRTRRSASLQNQAKTHVLALEGHAPSWPPGLLQTTLMYLAVILIVLIGLNGRWHLVSVTENRGLARYLARFAEPVQEAAGALVVEYSRLAAPFDHYFNLPVLGVDNERRESYAEIEAEWERLMRLFPDVPVFFLTPFQPPRSDRFVFTPVYHDTFTYQSLRQAGRNLPTNIRQSGLTLSLYRMRLTEGGTDGAWDWGQPYIARFDAGNMGVRRFANLRSGNWDIAGWPMCGESAVNWPGQYSNAELLAVGIRCDSKVATLSDIIEVDLTGEWMALRGFTVNGGLKLPPLFITALAAMTDTSAVDLLENVPASEFERRRLPAMRARWARTPGEILLPCPPEDTGRLLMLVRAPVVPEHDAVKLELRVAGRRKAVYMMSPNEWRWLIMPFCSDCMDYVGEELGSWVWLEMIVTPAWNPATRGFPSDLGVLAGMMVVLP